MSVGEIAGLISAIAFVLLVGVLAVPLIKLGRVLDATRLLIGGVSDQTVPLLDEVTTTVSTTNAQLARVDTITGHAATVAGNVSALTSLFSATLGGPLVKVAAFSYGVRRAAGNRRRADETKRVRSRLRDEKRAHSGTSRGGFSSRFLRSSRRVSGSPDVTSEQA
jgi:hypothetical protein